MDGLPVGYRFYPTEEELVSFYLQNQLKGQRPDINRLIPIIDIYDYSPSDLPQLGGEGCHSGLEQWFFFTPRQERKTRGGRPNRLTEKGYWKATGSPCDVYSSRNNRRIGRRKTMVFYEGRAPNGKKTTWKMNEYKLFDSTPQEPGSSSSAGSNFQLREEISLCRIYKKSKSLTEFDRRPPNEEEAGGETAAHHLRQPENETGALRIDGQRRDVATDGMVLNNKGSSSGEVIKARIINPPQSQPEEDDNYFDIATFDDQNQPLWDWEEFNWFDLWN